MTALLRLLCVPAALAAVARGADGAYCQVNLFRTHPLALKWVVDSGAIPEFAAFGVNRVTGTSHFNHGSGLSAEVGGVFGSWRAGLEFAQTALHNGFFADSQGHTGPFTARQRYRLGLLNAYRDLRLGGPLSLLIGAGLGGGRSNLHLDNGADHTDGSFGLFAWQVRGGLGVALTPQWSVVAALRFLHLEGGANTITFPRANFPFLQTVNTTSLTVADVWVRHLELSLRRTF